ncbi:MAG: glycerophosphodiester phosphodiesterase [Gemmatimonadales bacterium]
MHDNLPENSIAAFLAAIEAGASGIELDIHSSADGVLLVHHDPVVAGVDGPVPIASLDSKQLARIKLADDIAIPTLDDTLEAIGTRAAVFIEIKGRAIENDVVRCLRRHVRNIDAYAVHSFDHRTIKRMIELMPAIHTGILQVSYLVDSCRAMRAAGATDLWQHAEFVDASLVVDVHACGGRVIAWTPNIESEWQRLHVAGVDAVCTDKVGRYVAWRTTLQ